MDRSLMNTGDEGTRMLKKVVIGPLEQAATNGGTILDVPVAITQTTERTSLDNLMQKIQTEPQVMDRCPSTRCSEVRECRDSGPRISAKDRQRGWLMSSEHTRSGNTSSNRCMISISGPPDVGERPFSRNILSEWTHSGTTNKVSNAVIEQSSFHKNESLVDLKQAYTTYNDRVLRTSGNARKERKHFLRDLTTFMLVTPISVVVISSWNDLNNDARNRPTHSASNLDATRSPFSIMTEPGIAEFMLALVAYSISTVVYAQRHHGNHWQGCVLSTMLIGSIITGIGLGYDLQTTVLDIASWVAIAVLILSTAAQQAFYLFDRSRRQYWSNRQSFGDRKAERV